LIAPIAILSLLANIAVGLSSFDSNSLADSYPDSSRNFDFTIKLSFIGILASSKAFLYPLILSIAENFSISPVICAIFLWLQSIKYLVAVYAPLKLSALTIIHLL